MSSTPFLLLQKLKSLGIAGDIWLWIKDYLRERQISTIVNGSKSDSREVEFGVPQGSVLRPILFSLHCNDLPDIIQDKEEVIEMYADDNTTYATGPNPDSVVNTLNGILHKLSKWCLENVFTPHSGKTEYMLLRCSQFIGPLKKSSLQIAMSNWSIQKYALV